MKASPAGEDLNIMMSSPFSPASYRGNDRTSDRFIPERGGAGDAAGLPHCTAHGLRKAGATLAAELGATVNQLMAIFEQDTPAQAKVYTDAADRKRLAAQAMHYLAGRSD